MRKKSENEIKKIMRSIEVFVAEEMDKIGLIYTKIKCSIYDDQAFGNYVVFASTEIGDLQIINDRSQFFVKIKRGSYYANTTSLFPSLIPSLSELSVLFLQIKLLINTSNLSIEEIHTEELESDIAFEKSLGHLYKLEQKE